MLSFQILIQDILFSLLFNAVIIFTLVSTNFHMCFPKTRNQVIENVQDIFMKIVQQSIQLYQTRKLHLEWKAKKTKKMRETAAQLARCFTRLLKAFKFSFVTKVSRIHIFSFSFKNSVWNAKHFCTTRKVHFCVCQGFASWCLTFNDPGADIQYYCILDRLQSVKEPVLLRSTRCGAVNTPSDWNQNKKCVFRISTVSPPLNTERAV